MFRIKVLFFLLKTVIYNIIEQHENMKMAFNLWQVHLSSEECDASQVSLSYNLIFLYCYILIGVAFLSWGIESVIQSVKNLEMSANLKIK